MSTRIFQRLRVFVSSKLEELSSERAIIRAALEELRIDAWMFEEDGGARPESAQEAFLRELKESDLYLGIFWRGYGKYTITEYEYALKHDIPCLIYEKKSGAEGKRNSRLQAFLDRISDVQTGHSIRCFDSTEELGDLVKEDLVRWQAEKIRSYRAYPIMRNSAPATDKEHRDLLIVLEKVEQFWVKGVLEQSIYGEALLELSIQRQPGAVDHPWGQVLELPNKTTKRIPPGSRIDTIFDEIGCTLLILGAPGSGKTITLLDLARLLIERAKHDVTKPIPVVFNLSSWAERKESLFDWLIAEFKLKYNVPKRFSQQWLEENRLFLLLDGLDEAKADSRAACVEAINTFATEYGVPGLVVCCRLEEYSALPIRLRLGGAICIEPLKPRQVKDHLANAGGKLAALGRLIEEDAVLQSLASTPLMLSVMSLAYQGLDEEDITEKSLETEESRRTHLFNTYINRMFERKGSDNTQYPKKQVKLWLRWLARSMQDQSKTIFHIEELQVTWLASRIQQLFYVFSSRLIGGIILGLMLGLGLMHDTNVMMEIGDGFLLIGSLIIGASFGVMGGLIDGSLLVIRNHSGKVDQLPSILHALIYIIIFCFIAGLFFGLIIGLISYGLIGLLFGILGGLVLGVYFGGLWGFRSAFQNGIDDIRPIERLVWSWNSAKNGSRNGVVGSLIISLICGLLAGLIGGFSFGLSLGLYVGLIGVAFFGLIGGIWGGLTSVILTGKSRPNQGIILSIRNASIGGLVVGLSYVLGFGISDLVGFGLLNGLDFGLPEEVTNGLKKDLSIGFSKWLNGGLFVLPLALFWYGVQDIIQHYVLRGILWSQGHIPLLYSHFLDHSVQLILLRKVGGGYIFIHRMLLEHFNAMNESEQDLLVNPTIQR